VGGGVAVGVAVAVGVGVAAATNLYAPMSQGFVRVNPS
jgi:hypothetical protein